MLANYSYTSILKKAWPIILANAAVPILGLIDTAVIGNLGSATQIGAIALGSLIFSFIYWSFGFLRMSTTGFTAQEQGAGNFLGVVVVLIRAILLSAVIGLLIIAFQLPLSSILFFLFDASQAVEVDAQTYFSIRIWGAPATLALFSLMGTLIGLGKSREVLYAQLFLNGLNAILDVYFAAYLNLGIKGIAVGTLISEYLTVAFVGAMVYHRVIKSNNISKRAISWNDILIRDQVTKMISANRDIFLRTIFLLFSFAWFTNESAKFGDITLAANHILLQFISFSAFFLDGFAFVAEALVGSAFGARNIKHFDAAVKSTSILAGVTAFILSLLILLGGNLFIELITDVDSVRVTANSFLFIAALYILLSFPAFQLDGVFIGAVQAARMRNASIFATLGFLLLSWPLTTNFGNQGLWFAFVLYVIFRAAALAYQYPKLRAQVSR